MLLVVVEWPWRKASPWRAYTRTFTDEEEFLAWWHSLPESGFTRSKAVVKTYEASEVGLVAPWALPA